MEGSLLLFSPLHPKRYDRSHIMAAKIGGGPNVHQSIPTPANDNNAINKDVNINIKSDIKTIESNKAWNDFASIKDMVPQPTKSAMGTSNSPLRQQIALMSQKSNVSSNINAGSLAQQFGINTNDLILSGTSNLTAANTNGAPTIGTNSNTQAAPLADSRAPVSPEMHPSRGEAKAKFEQILEQTHMPFDTKADNMARELSRDSELLSALNPAEKGRLIQILGSGMTGEADQKAINNILGSANNKAEFFGMVQMAGGPQRLNDTLFNPKQQREFRFMLDKFTYDTGPANSPQRAQAKQAFEDILRKSHQPFDTQADDMVRNLTTNSELMGSLTPMEKGRLISVLGSGWTGEQDESSIISILRGSNGPADFWQTVQSAGGPGRIDGMIDWKQQGQFNYLKEKFGSMYSPMPQMPTTGMMNTGMMNTGMMNTGMMNTGMMGTTPITGDPATVFNQAYSQSVQGFNNSMMAMNGMSSPFINGYNSGYGMGMPGYNMGMGTGMYPQHDLGIGRTFNQQAGGFFKSILKGVGNLIKQALPIAISAGIGFLTGGPAGAAMGAASALMQSPIMGNMMSMTGGAFPNQQMMMGLFSTLMGGGTGAGAGSLLGAVAS